jgi:hypothetical protein
MRVRNLFAGLAIGALGVTGAFAAMPAGAQTAPTTTDPTATGNQPEPAAETTQCQFGHWPADVQGVPASFHSGSAAGLYLWHTDTGWKAAVTHPGHFPVVFKIRVESSGKIYGVERHDEGHDDVRVNATRTAAGLRSVDWGYIDGMAFRTACAEHIVVSGTIDGLPLRNEQVFIGANGHHPDSVPFAIERQR